MANPEKTSSNSGWIGALFWAAGIVIAIFVIMSAIGGDGSSNKIHQSIILNESNIETISDTIVNDAAANNGKIFGNVDANVSKRNKSAYDIVINFLTGDYISPSSAKNQIEGFMRDLYFDLFKNVSNLNSVVINGFMPLMDQYGNIKNKLVYTAKLTGKDAYKINWQQDYSTVKFQIIPNLWVKEYVSDIFNDGK